MKIYEILPTLYLGQILDVPEEPGIAPGFTRTPCNLLPQSGEWVKWGNNEWYITTTPPPEPEPEPEEPQTIPEPEPLVDADYEPILPVPEVFPDIATALAIANAPEK